MFKQDQERAGMLHELPDPLEVPVFLLLAVHLVFSFTPRAV